MEVVPQCAGGLDERLAGAFAGCDGPALLIGMDTPQVTPELLTVDFADCDAWFGPAADGGFWALGLADPDPGLLRGVPMSTPHTGPCNAGVWTGCGYGSCRCCGTWTRPVTRRPSPVRRPTGGSPRGWPG